MSANETSTERLDELRAGQVAALYRNSVPGTVGGLLAATILSAALIYRGAIPVERAAAFIAILLTHSTTRFILIRAYHRAKPSSADWRPWAVAGCVTALVGGFAWGAGSLLLMDVNRPENQLIVLIVCAGMAAGSITAFGTYLPSYYCSLFSMMTPTAIWAAAQDDTLLRTYAVQVVLWIVVSVFLARTFNAMLTESLRLQFENLDLAMVARQQTARAEEANIAKSRFLASASHDLRQPVHALGMFVGALRGRDMDQESVRLVGQIENSITALDGLFTSLLDISRLDAGVVSSRLRTFPIQPLLERIIRDEAPVAAGKDIELILIPSRATVRSDPILLERILRNLISNAVRYTDKGRVLIGCRRGQRLSVEVWDTGRGIAADQRDLIFQEFYQIGNPERDRTRGLGLGLAIVRRLTAILEIPLVLRSEPDKGSVFKLSLELVPASESTSANAADMPLGTVSPRFIVVVDDEVAIQDAMSTLLTAWGHSVVVAGSCHDMLKRLADCPTRPDLIISDYRLRGEENGIEAIQRLRSEFNEDIPAILITGDTAPHRLKEASESSCFLMHKPVSNSRLRAAITNLTIAGAQPVG